MSPQEGSMKKTEMKAWLVVEFAMMGVLIAIACHDAQLEKSIKRTTLEIESEESDYAKGVVADEWNYLPVMPQYNSLYMGVHCITDETSPQYQWLESHNWDYDEEGICTYDGRTLVALTATFGAIGDYVDLLLADGTILETVIVDEKADAGIYGHEHDGWTNVLEIIVSPEWYETEHENKVYPEVVGWRNIS